VCIDLITDLVDTSMHQPDLLCDQCMIFAILFAENMQIGSDDAADSRDDCDDDRGAIH
jgi:hypothetical protein